jgi:hypothetical protein
MKITIDHAGQFRDEFFAHNRQNQFSYEALELLFDYLEELDPDMELDVVAICCDYSEDSPEDIAAAYSLENEEMAHDYVADNGTYVGTTSTGSIVYADF